MSTLDLPVFEANDPLRRESFEQNGVIYVDRLLSDSKMEEAREALARIEALAPRLPEALCTWYPDGSLRVVQDLQRFDSWFADLLEQSRIIEAVRGAVEWEPVPYYMEYFAKAPGAKKILAHQEHYTLEIEPPELLHVWIPLVDADEESGNLVVYPGTHEFGVVPHLLHAPTPSIDDQVVEKVDRFRYERPVSAGSAVIFDGHLIHLGGPNLTDRPCPRLILGYRGAETTIPTELEAIASQIARVFREVRGEGSLDPDADFFEEGDSHSTARRAVEVINGYWGVELVLSDVERCSNPRTLAARLIEIRNQSNDLFR
jgi:hypothetical protein